MSLRTDRVANEIRRNLGQVISDSVSEFGGGMITVTHVVVSPDLSIAKIYVSIFGTVLSSDKILEKLHSVSHRFKKSLQAKMRLRIMPELRFYLDDSLDKIDKITEILAANKPFESSQSSVDSAGDVDA